MLSIATLLINQPFWPLRVWFLAHAAAELGRVTEERKHSGADAGFWRGGGGGGGGGGPHE